MFHDHLLPAMARSLTPNHNETTTNPSSKRKRRPAGTPDPDAEVVALSPKTLLESDRYVCEICNQGFQRDQNLQMHRRRHKVPWKLLKRETAEARKRVFVCPEPTCLHHDPRHALGDLVGIKKHYRRKHSSHRQWVCARCSKAYAVQSDYKAHLKTCGTRGHSCDCGRVFSRVESFIEHQDICHASRQPLPDIPPTHPPVCMPPASRGPELSSNEWLGLAVMPPASNGITNHLHHNVIQPCNFELQLLPASLLASPVYPSPPFPVSKETTNTQLHLSVGSPNASMKTDVENAAAKEKEEADEARRQAKMQVEMAEEDFIKARRLRQEAHMELTKAQLLRDHALKQINSMLLQITCFSCRQQLQSSYPFPNVCSNDYHGQRKDKEGESEV